VSRDIRPFAQWPVPKAAVTPPTASLAYFVESEPDVFDLTIDGAEATHGLDAASAGVWDLTPLEDIADPVRMSRVGAETYFIREL